MPHLKEIGGLRGQAKQAEENSNFQEREREKQLAAVALKDSAVKQSREKRTTLNHQITGNDTLSAVGGSSITLVAGTGNDSVSSTSGTGTVFQGGTGLAVLVAGLWAGLLWGSNGQLPLLISGLTGGVFAVVLIGGQLVRGMRTGSRPL